MKNKGKIALYTVLIIVSVVSVFSLFFKFFNNQAVDIVVEVVSVIGSSIFLAILVTIMLEHSNEKQREKRNKDLRRSYLFDVEVELSVTVSHEAKRLGVTYKEPTPIKDAIQAVVSAFIKETDLKNEHYFVVHYEGLRNNVGKFCDKRDFWISNAIFSNEEITSLKKLYIRANTIAVIIRDYEKTIIKMIDSKKSGKVLSDEDEKMLQSVITDRIDMFEEILNVCDVIKEIDDIKIKPRQS